MTKNLKRKRNETDSDEDDLSINSFKLVPKHPDLFAYQNEQHLPQDVQGHNFQWNQFFETYTEQQKFVNNFKTPLEQNERLSDKFDCNIYFKREDLNKVRSYKIRGAFKKISQILKENKSDQPPLIVCASAGNHAQGVAQVCKKFKLVHHIFVPKSIPNQKVKAIEFHGGHLLTLHYEGKQLNESIEAAQEYSRVQNGKFVHPYDDYDVITGQSTLGIEIALQCMKKNITPDVICVGVGGGGCASGVATTTKLLFPDTKIQGAEPENADKLNMSFKLNRHFVFKNVDTFADGTAMRGVGLVNQKVLKNLIERNIIVVPKNKLCQDIIQTQQNDGIVLEPSGCLSISALDELKDHLKGKNVVCILSGGNNDLMRQPEIMECSDKQTKVEEYQEISLSSESGSVKFFFEKCVLSKFDIVHVLCKKRDRRGCILQLKIEYEHISDKRIFENLMQEYEYSYKLISDESLKHLM